MTKKDYVLIARTIYYFGRSNQQLDYSTIESLVNEFCYALKQQNPRFDENKFRQAVDDYFEEWKKEIEADQYQ